MEEWKPIPDYPNYKVSNLGNITKFGKIKKSTRIGNKYKSIYLTNNKERKSLSIHTLVAMLFLNHIPGGYDKVVDHINGNIQDNRVINLQIISQRENVIKNKFNKHNYIGAHKVSKNTYQSRITINKKRIHLGSYKTPKEAFDIYQLAVQNKNSYTGDNEAFRKLLKKELV